MKNKGGQVTIFIIIAILIVAGIVAFFLVRQNITVSNIPSNMEPVYNQFLSCLEDKTWVGIDVMESQGGYIALPEFEAGSSYMPFGSQLNFLGNPIPYWYYISGNNIEKEQIPTQNEMEDDLAEFINERVRNCNFENYYASGFEIIQGEPETTVEIEDSKINVKVKMNFQITKGEDTFLIENHGLFVESYLGTLYNSAKKVYNTEQEDLFLENYGLDTLRLYAPVDGAELTCGVKTWNADDIFADVKEAIELNTMALNSEYSKTSEGKYFSVNTGVSEDVSFFNSQDWSSSFEVLPSEGNILIAEPIGNQEGLGVLGFCYVPYHFVYNIKYPVLIQVSKSDETFQFPMAVVILGNKPRESLGSNASFTEAEFCPYKNTGTVIKTHDTGLNYVSSSISYECFGETCYIGNSSGVLSTKLPQCVNGYLLVEADGFKKKRFLYSSVSEGSAEIILDKLYNLSLNLKLDGADYGGEALIYFSSDDDSKSVYYPDTKSVELAEGEYTISVYIYKDSSVSFSETTSQQCMEVTGSGLGGLFGFTEKKCFDVTVPSQVISTVLAGGGTQNSYFLESQLGGSSIIEINSDSFKTPTNIEELQENYLLFDESKLEVDLK